MYGGSVFDGLDGRVLQDPNVDVLLDQIPAPIFVKDNDFRYTHVNETFCSLLNIKKTDFVGKSVWDIATPELAKVYDAADRRLVEEGGIQTYESKAHTSKGGVVWVQFQKKCIFDQSGGFRGILGIAKDITDLKLAEDRSRRASKVADLGYWELNHTSGALDWSKQTFRIFGLDPEAPQPSFKGFLDLVHPEDRTKVETAFQEHLATGQPYDVVHRLIINGVGLKYVRERAETEFSEIGVPQVSMGTVSDVSRIIQDQEVAKSALLSAVEVCARALEKRDPYTAGHQQRVVELAVRLASYLGEEDAVIEGIRLGAMVHDIGKIAVPAEILNKPGRLSSAEFDLIKLHPTHGYEILAPMEFPWPIAEMVYQHHERVDGSGYPRGLTGDHILREAKIISVADTIEAIVSHRPYRPAKTIEDALTILEAQRGKGYAPEVVDAALALHQKGQLVLEGWWG